MLCLESEHALKEIPAIIGSVPGNFELDMYADVYLNGEHIGKINNFVDSILNGTQLISPGIDAVNELSISNAAYLSAWQNNKEISIPFDTEQFDAFLLEHSTDNKHINTEKKEQPNGNYSERWSVRW